MAKRSTEKPQDRDWHVPLAETLEWITKGELLQGQWASRKGAAAEKMSESLHKRLEKLRKEAEKLWELHQAEVKAKKKNK
jgi:hypothetical protein